MNNSVLEEAMENVKKHRDIEVVLKIRGIFNLVLEPNFHTTKCFSEKLLTIEMNQKNIKTNSLVYLSLSVLDISKIAMCEYWYDHVKLIVHIKSEDVYADLAKDFEKGFDT